MFINRTEMFQSKFKIFWICLNIPKFSTKSKSITFLFNNRLASIFLISMKPKLKLLLEN